jgi:hypothetical protein
VRGGGAPALPAGPAAAPLLARARGCLPGCAALVGQVPPRYPAPVFLPIPARPALPCQAEPPGAADKQRDHDHAARFRRSLDPTRFFDLGQRPPGAGGSL